MCDKGINDLTIWFRGTHVQCKPTCLYKFEATHKLNVSENQEKEQCFFVEEKKEEHNGARHWVWRSLNRDAKRDVWRSSLFRRDLSHRVIARINTLASNSLWLALFPVKNVSAFSIENHKIYFINPVR